MVGFGAAEELWTTQRQRGPEHDGEAHGTARLCKQAQGGGLDQQAGVFTNAADSLATRFTDGTKSLVMQ